MRAPWEKRESETGKAFGAFCRYREMGPGRSLKACTEDHGLNQYSCRKWSSVHDWEKRASAWDITELERHAAGREQVRERARQALMDDALESCETLQGVRVGRVPMPECGSDCTLERCMCGVWQPILDRHGKVVGRKPTVAPSTRQGAALATLDRCGMTPPKRVELTGKDGEKLRLEARLALGGLDDDKLGALLAAFEPGSDD